MALTKKHYGRRDLMAAFTAERQAILKEHEKRAEDAQRYEVWARVASSVFDRARDDELKAIKGTRREAYVHTAFSLSPSNHASSILDRICSAGFDDVVTVLRHPKRDQFRFIPTRDAQRTFFDGHTFVKNPKPLTDQSE
jgi:hypothetical protein